MYVPDEVVRRLRGVPEDRVAEEGLKLCAEIVQQVREIPGVAGVHVMAFGWEEAVPEILERAGVRSRPRGGGSRRGRDWMVTSMLATPIERIAARPEGGRRRPGPDGGPRGGARGHRRSRAAARGLRLDPVQAELPRADRACASILPSASRHRAPERQRRRRACAASSPSTCAARRLNPSAQQAQRHCSNERASAKTVYLEDWGTWQSQPASGASTRCTGGRSALGAGDRPGVRAGAARRRERRPQRRRRPRADPGAVRHLGRPGRAARAARRAARPGARRRQRQPGAGLAGRVPCGSTASAAATTTAGSTT